MSDIVKYNTDHGEVELTKDTVRKYLVSGGGAVSDQEITMFLALCKYQQLNPYLREAYLIKYSGDSPATMIVGKDTFTKRAAKNEQYDGCEAGVIVLDDRGEVTNREGTLVLDGERLAGGWARGYRKDWSKPVFGSVNYSEYEGKKKDGSTNRIWKKQPATMIRKVALVQMLRELFPDMFQGLYDSSEMDVDSTELPEKTIQMPKEKTDERNITPDSGGSGESVPKGDEPKVEKQDSSPKADEPPKEEAAVEQEIESSITDKMAKLKDKCETGITMMGISKIIDKVEKEAYEKEIKEYLDSGNITRMEILYHQLFDMYQERNKKRK